jgi:hypothetical protein
LDEEEGLFGFLELVHSDLGLTIVIVKNVIVEEISL